MLAEWRYWMDVFMTLKLDVRRQIHKGLSYVINAAIRPQNGSNLYDELLNGIQQKMLKHGTTIPQMALKKFWTRKIKAKRPYQRPQGQYLCGLLRGRTFQKLNIGISRVI